MIDDPISPTTQEHTPAPVPPSRWVDIADRADVGLLRLDAGGHLVDINAAATRLLGRGIDTLRCVEFSTLVALSQREHVRNAMQAVHGGKSSSVVAVRFPRPQGGAPAVLCRFTDVRDFTGILRAYTVTLFALGESQPPDLPALDGDIATVAASVPDVDPDGTYRAVFEAIDQGFCVIEVLFEDDAPVDYRFIETNRAFERYTGLADAVGRTIRELVPKHEAHWFRFYGEIVRTQQQAQTMLPAAAMGRWYEVHAFPFGPPADHRVAVLFEDVSARVRTEQALRDSEERFRCLANATPSMLWSATANGDTTWLSERWSEYTGQSDAVSRDQRNRAIHPDDRERTAEAWRLALTGDHFETELRLRRHDGEYRWFIVRANPAHDEAGRLVGWYGSTTDIHDFKVAETALREIDRRKDEFLATLAHELRNPLAPLRNCLQILRMVDSGEAGAQVDTERLHAVMERQVGQLVRLVDDLLEVSRITRGMVPLHLQSVALNDIVERAIETSRPLLDAAHHTLAVSMPAESLVLHVDPVRLAQVLSNLLNNAAKYTEPGGRIQLSARREGDEVVLLVQDNGLGMATDQVERVFDLFHQAEHSLGRAAGGLGIGLTLVRSLVEMHGGVVIARSAGVGQGSEFEVRLKIGHEEATPLPPRPDVPVLPGSRLRLLVVDDNREHTDSLALFMRMQGHAVRTAYDAASALTWQGAFSPDAVLLDLGMPGVDGYEVCRRLRSNDGGDALVVVAITGWGQTEDRRRSAEAGCDAHLVKPVDPVALLSLVDSLVRMKRRR
jgi:PAS domain S-box-containing protein